MHWFLNAWSQIWPNLAASVIGGGAVISWHRYRIRIPLQQLLAAVHAVHQDVKAATEAPATPPAPAPTNAPVPPAP